jgi:hypothetical protein
VPPAPGGHRPGAGGHGGHAYAPAPAGTLPVAAAKP